MMRNGIGPAFLTTITLSPSKGVTVKKLFVLFFIFLCFTSAVAQKQAAPQDKDTDVTSYRVGSETYPGVEAGEVFLCVISTKFFAVPVVFRDGTTSYDFTYGDMATDQNFEEIGWKTKRLGKVAYNKKGEKMDDWRPVFVQKKELQEAGVLKE